MAQFHDLTDRTYEPPRARTITKAYDFKIFLRVPSWPWWLTVSQIEPVPDKGVHAKKVMDHAALRSDLRSEKS